MLRRVETLQVSQPGVLPLLLPIGVAALLAAGGAACHLVRHSQKVSASLMV